MSQRFGDNPPVVKVDLKRANAAELVQGDKVLSASPFVRALGNELGRVLNAAVIRRYPDKVVLMQQGDVGQSLFFVISGDVRLFARRDADSVELGVAHKGEVLGEAEALSGTTARACSAVAQGQVDVFELPRTALLTAEKVLPAVQAFLQDVKARRGKALDEMSDFMNRW